MKENDNQQADYIGLSSIKTAILDLFRIIFRALDFIGRSIRRHLLLFILCPLLGMGLAWLYTQLKPEMYRSSMILYHNDLTRKDYNQIIGNLNQLLLGPSRAEFAEELHLPPDYARGIVSMQLKDMDGNLLVKDTSTRKNQLFKIEVLFNTELAPRPLQDAVLKYLNSNVYIDSMKNGLRRIYQEKLLYITAEQQRLDSLKILYNRALTSMRMPATFYNNALNPAEIYVQSNNLANQKTEIERWLSLESEAVILVDGLKPPTTTRLYSLRLLLLIGLGVGLLAGIVLCLLAEVRTRIRY